MATQVVNASLGTTPYRVTLGDDSHQWLSDVPAALGSGDGPSPHEILLSALGACTAITVAMYAQRKEWPLEGIDVQLNIVENAPSRSPSPISAATSAWPAISTPSSASVCWRSPMPARSIVYSPERSASAASYATEPARTTRSTA